MLRFLVWGFLYLFFHHYCARQGHHLTRSSSKNEEKLHLLNPGTVAVMQLSYTERLIYKPSPMSSSCDPSTPGVHNYTFHQQFGGFSYLLSPFCCRVLSTL